MLTWPQKSELGITWLLVINKLSDIEKPEA